jgi:rubrerythrin
VEFSADKPPHCPVCGAESGKLVQHEVSGMKGTKTLNNLQAGFVAESQAHLRNLAFAMKAEQEVHSQVAILFRAIAEVERENLAASAYPQFVRVANEEGNESVAKTFSYSRDVEKGHANLYKRALAHMMAGEETDYYVCQVCGRVSDGIVPDVCPICGAPGEKFRKVV